MTSVVAAIGGAAAGKSRCLARLEGKHRLTAPRLYRQLREEGLGDLKIADYGTRRRFSQPWHEEVLRIRKPRSPMAIGKKAETDRTEP